MLYTALKPSVLKRSNSERPVSRSVLDELVGDSCCEARNGGGAFALEAATKFEINSPAIKKQVSVALILKLLKYETPQPHLGVQPQRQLRLPWVTSDGLTRSRPLAATPFGLRHTLPVTKRRHGSPLNILAARGATPLGLEP